MTSEISVIRPRDSASPQVDWLAVRLEERYENGTSGAKAKNQKVIMLPSGLRIKHKKQTENREFFVVEDGILDVDEVLRGCEASVKRLDVGPFGVNWRKDFLQPATSFLSARTPSSPSSATATFKYDKNTARDFVTGSAKPGKEKIKLASGIVELTVNGSIEVTLDAVIEVDPATLEPKLPKNTSLYLRPWYNPRLGANYRQFSSHSASWLRIVKPGLVEASSGFALHVGRYSLGCISVTPDSAKKDDSWQRLISLLMNARTASGDFLCTLEISESSTPGKPIIRFPIELTQARPPASIPTQGRTFFTIYYINPVTVPDHAFAKAAEQWSKDIEIKEEFRNGVDTFISKPVTYKDEFIDAWNEIATQTSNVWCGNVFTHAAIKYFPKRPNPIFNHVVDGLEFKPRNSGDSGTLTEEEIQGLQQLDWSSPASFLILSGCNTGVRRPAVQDLVTEIRLFAPAETFARSQDVITLGQAGYSYFSTTWESHTETKPTDRDIVLWSFKRARNLPFSPFEWNRRIPGVVFMPAESQDPPKLDLNKLPDIMLDPKNNLPKGAEIMKQWLQGPPRIAPDYAGVNDTLITMNWILKPEFRRGLELYNAVVADEVWTKFAALEVLVKVLRRKGLLVSAPMSFGIIGTKGSQVHDDHFQTRSASWGFLDGLQELVGPTDLTAAIARFSFHFVAGGTVEPTADSHRISIREIGIYARDSFDFNGAQFLGYWDDNDNSISIANPLTGVPVTNNLFREWRAANNHGGDIEIFSDINRITPAPFEFLAKDYE